MQKQLLSILRIFGLVFLWTVAPRIEAQNSSSRRMNISVTPHAGDDVGKDINVADERLGNNCGLIVVTGGAEDAAVITVVRLSACHDLILQRPLKWLSTLSLQGRNRVFGIGDHAEQTIAIPGAWMRAQATAHIEIAKLKTNWPVVAGGDDGNRVLLCRQCTDVFVHDTQTSGGGYIKTDSSASRYLDVTAGNSSHQIRAVRNVVDGRDGPKGGVQAAWYAYSWDVEDTDGRVSNAGLAYSWWGGNNNTDWTSYDTNTLKAGRMHFARETVSNVVAGWWGSMGQVIDVMHVRADGCEDVCLDSEGDSDSTFSYFFTTNASNGELSSFFHAQKVLFHDGEVLHVNASKGHSYFNNNATNDASRSRDVIIQKVKFRCADPSLLCSISLDPLGSFTLRESEVRNTRITNSTFAPEQGDIALLSNVFLVDRHTARAASLVDASTKGSGGLTLCANTFVSSVRQPAGLAAIVANNSYNLGRAEDIVIAQNRSDGWPVLAHLSNSSTLRPLLVSANNRFVSEWSESPFGFNMVDPSSTKALRQLEVAECRTP